MKQIIITIVMCITATFIMAEPAKTTLKDYAFDFTQIGYEISFQAKTSYFSDPMNSNDYFEVSSDGYTHKGANGGQAFVVGLL